jgi:outer membrane protein, heavy metal efflux system
VIGSIWCGAVALVLVVAAGSGSEAPSGAPGTGVLGPAGALDELGHRGKAVTLEALLSHAARNAPDLTRSRARVSLGEAQTEGAKPVLPDNPSAGVALGARVNPLGTNFEAQATISQSFEVAGERRRRLAAGRAAETARRADVDRTWWETEVEIRAAFNAAIVAREAALAQAQTVAFSERLMRAAEVRVSAGDLAPLTLRIAQTDVADARQQLLQLELEYRNACVRLAQEAGWPGAEPIEPIGDLPKPVATRDVSPRIGDWVDAHPAVLAADADIDAAESRVVAANRDAWPHPALGAYMAHEQEPGTPFASNVGLVTLSLPLPLWRRNQDERASARANLNVAKADASALRYELGQEIRIRAEAVRTAAQRVTTYAEEMLPAFSENLGLLERAYDLGEIDILQVFVGQQRFMNQQRRALEVYDEYVQAVRAYELVSGRRLRGDTAASAPLE